MDVVEAEMAGVEILELMAGARAVMLIDAAREGQAPGTIHRLDASAGPIAWDEMASACCRLGTDFLPSPTRSRCIFSRV